MELESHLARLERDFQSRKEELDNLLLDANKDSEEVYKAELDDNTTKYNIALLKEDADKDSLVRVLEADNAESLERYNSYITRNTSRITASLQKLTQSYTRIVEETHKLYAATNLIKSKLESETDPVLKRELQSVLDNYPRLDNIRLTFKQYLVDTPEYLYRFNVGKYLAKELVPDILPDDNGEYILTIPLHHRTIQYPLIINGKRTEKSYKYCVYEPLDMFVIYYVNSITYKTDVIFMRISTQDYLMTQVEYMTNFIYYDNNIVGYTDSELDMHHDFYYYVFKIHTLEYNVTRIPFEWPKKLHLYIKSSRNSKTLFHINKHRWLQYMKLDQPKPDWVNIMQLNFTSLGISSYRPHFEIESLKSNILTIATIMLDDTVKYVSIELPYDYVLDMSLNIIV